MKPGSVLVDIAIDQGGCFADSRPTTYAEPTYPVHGSVFYCVANMPGAVPHTSTYALTNATLPYVLKLANQGWRAALAADPALAAGLSTHDGQLTSEPVARDLGLPHTAAGAAGGLMPGGTGGSRLRFRRVRRLVGGAGRGAARAGRCSASPPSSAGSAAAEPGLAAGRAGGPAAARGGGQPDQGRARHPPADRPPCAPRWAGPSRSGWRPRSTTRAPGRPGRPSSAGADVVLACGGDGTVRAVAEALAGTGVAMGLIPAGTGNLLARTIGTPQDVVAATRVALAGDDRKIDVGRVRVDDAERRAGLPGDGRHRVRRRDHGQHAGGAEGAGRPAGLRDLRVPGHARAAAPGSP